MRPFNAHKVQNKVQKIHLVSIEPKLPTMSKITSIDLNNKIVLYSLQILHTPNNSVSLHILKELALIHQVLVPRQKRELLHVLV